MPPQGRGPGPTGPANFNAFSHYQPSQQAPNSQPTPALTASSLGSHNGFPTPQNTNFNAFTSNGNHNYRSLGNGLNGGGTGSASQAAQMGFAQMGAASDFYPNDGVGLRTPPTSRIRDVWQSNLEEEMISLRSLVDRFPYISVVSQCFRSHTLSFEDTKADCSSRLVDLGCGVPWNSSQTYGQIQLACRLSLSDCTMQH